MADQTVPPRRARDGGRWDDAGDPTAAYRALRDGEPVRSDVAAHPTRGRHAQHDDHPDPVGGYGPPRRSHRGPQWVAPDGSAHTTGDDVRVGGHLSPVATYPDDEQGGLDRRRALSILGGGVAAVAGGAALAVAPGGQALVASLFGDEVANPTAAITDGNPSRPGGQQPASVRTYTEQNESYMGSRAGEALKRNAPTGGQTFPDGPAGAAGRTKPSARGALAADAARHLASRATFGATGKVLADIRKMGIDAWLRWQLEPDKIAPTRAELKLAELSTLNLSIRQLRERREELAKKGVRAHHEMIRATIARQIWSDRQLFEVMVDFWNDFLHVGPDYDGAEITRASFDRDVIRKHALGNYADMLVAANRHPALLRYLNQDQSSKDSPNENLARENLELYSVGVDGGYTEKDVRQAALLQTGRGIKDDEYVYRADRHFVGPVKILDFTHKNASAAGGEAAADAYFRYLANHPSTARYVAQSLAVRFVCDTPPKALVERLAKAYTTHKTAVKPVLMTLFASSEFWASVGQKVRRPMEYLVATYRTLGVSPEPSPDFKADGDRRPFTEGLRQIHDKLEELGQFPTGQPTPDGYPDVYVAWTSAGAMVNGWNAAGDLVQGRRREFSYTKPERLVARPPATAGDYLDALALRLVHQKLTGKQKAALLGIAGVGAGTKVDATFDGAVGAIARALLASPLHHLR